MAILEPTPLTLPPPEPVLGGERLLSTPFFDLLRYPLAGELRVRAEGPTLLTLLEGEARLGEEVMRPPATLLLEPGEEAVFRGEGLWLAALAKEGA